MDFVSALDKLTPSALIGKRRKKPNEILVKGSVLTKRTKGGHVWGRFGWGAFRINKELARGGEKPIRENMEKINRWGA